jgi:hypothetical protein
LRKLILVVSFCTLFFAGSAYAQFAPKGDLSIGFGSLISTSSSSATGNYSAQTVGGGLYPTVRFDFLLHHNLGVGAEMSWRASRNLYQGYEPFRPIIYDFNAVYEPRFGKVGLDLQAGIGAESARFYPGSFQCNFFTCTDYVSTNHFLGHFGGGIKLYVHGNFFVEPEAHLYLIHNNLEFSSGKAERVGASIGYTF